MPIRVEAYTAGGVATGVVARSGPLREALDDAGDLLVERAHWLPLDGSGEQPAGELRLTIDDLLLLVAEEAEGGPVHAQWHDDRAPCRPLRVVGEMPTMPGFDPGRALARPTGEFVLLRDVRICLVDRARRRRGAAPRGSSSTATRRPGRGRPDARVLLPGRRDGAHGGSGGQAAAGCGDAGAAHDDRRGSAGRERAGRTTTADRRRRLTRGVIAARRTISPGRPPPSGTGPACGAGMLRARRAAPGAAAAASRIGPTAERPRLDVPIGDEALLDRPRDRLAEQPLDAPQQVGLVDADEADRVARRRRPGPSGRSGGCSPAGSTAARSSRRGAGPRCRGRGPRRRSRRGPGSRPLLNPSRARVRSGCDAVAVDRDGVESLARSSHVASRVAAIFVRVKTSTWRRSCFRIRWASSSSLRSRSTG